MSYSNVKNIGRHIKQFFKQFEQFYCVLIFNVPLVH